MTDPDASLRVSDAERDETLRILGEHASVGRLTLDELEERSGRALAAKTRGELATLTGDLPQEAGQGRPAPKDHQDPCRGGSRPSSSASERTTVSCPGWRASDRRKSATASSLRPWRWHCNRHGRRHGGKPGEALGQAVPIPVSRLERIRGELTKASRHH